MFGFFETVERYVDITFINGGIRAWISYGSLLAAVLLWLVVARIYVFLKPKAK